MINLLIDDSPITLRTLKFSGGEIQPRLIDYPESATRISITAHVWSADDLMELLLVTSALQYTYPRVRPALKIPYLPYARQDRICHPGEAFSLEVICRLLQAQNYASIEVWDPHSGVVNHLLRYGRFLPALHFVKNISTVASDGTVIVAPDKGARSRAIMCAEALYCDFVQAEKTRDPDTGQLGEPTVQTEHIGHRDFLIVDDLCDGGRTFVNLARRLRPMTDGKIHLYVTHGIFSAGFIELRETIDHIYVANLHPHARPIMDFLTVLPEGER